MEWVCVIWNLELMPTPSGTFEEWHIVMEKWTRAALQTLVDPELLFVLFAYSVISVTKAVGEVATPLILRSDFLLFDLQHPV